jgi:hypothetical protein
MNKIGASMAPFTPLILNIRVLLAKYLERISGHTDDSLLPS